jgi:GNAT superfamily N-acetyltransferase
MKIILAGEKIKLQEVTDDYFETKIYNNSGILDPNIKGFIRFQKKDTIVLNQIYVHPDQRRKGIATKMLGELKKQKKRIITITNTNESEIFGRFLIKEGFKDLGNKRWEYGNS